MKITMLVGYFAPELSADTHLNVDMAEDFAALGAVVTVIAPFPTRGVDADTQQAYLSLREERRGDRLRILRLGQPGRYKSGLVDRGLDFLKKTWRLYRAASAVETDVYFVISTPPFLGYAAALLAKRAPVVYKLQDVFPDSLVSAGKLSPGGPAARLLHLAERWVYRRVTQIHASSGDIRDTLLKKGVSAEKLRVIYDWIDETACVPVAREDNPLFDRFSLPREGFYVSYAGNIGLLQNVETILSAARILKTEAPEIRFVLIGGGAWETQMHRLIDQWTLSNVQCFPMQPMAEVSNVYSLGDVELVSLKPGVSRLALPSKTWSILSAGRPVVCEIDEGCELSALLEREGCGRCVAPGNARTLADVLVELSHKPAEERAAMGCRGRAFVERTLTRRRATAQHFTELSKLVKQGD